MESRMVNRDVEVGIARLRLCRLWTYIIIFLGLHALWTQTRLLCGSGKHRHMIQPSSFLSCPHEGHTRLIL
ncbi:hypothetical protein BDV98DRAFT_569834 [Pterulicium gracile]|uniref:Uncharacterized protein n=1 Tax=Pterulicium gracile TaxID=1884261 RepID=A0A5C3QFK8_9AGAR|nr:hypothetical protein BDV98DRAFT_569834 [Pterula gracilis]